MKIYNNPMSNLSYTNKDFQTILPELIDTVKKLTYRWDPSISNESDPGVVLLKLNAIIADKNNYAIDKNILECFPQSVTQDKNAMQLFEQLGYNMRGYVSATTDVSFRWIDEQNTLDYTIPKFTMVSDSEGELVYTITEDCIISGNGSPSSVPAIQGKAVQYKINNQTLITPMNLDSNNRLYFTDYNIAQNGIFITNAGRQNYSSWKSVKNLTTQTLGTTAYKFGIDSNNGYYYIQFPDDAEELLGDGINVTYIKSNGIDGNIPMRTLENFLVPITINNPGTGDKTLTINADIVQVNNFKPAYNGLDPETINEAYRNYVRTVGTFDTLITLRDYINYIYTSGLVSNCVVTDRTNDIQHSYTIVSDNNGLVEHHTYTDVVDDKPILNAFDLKLYLLQYTDTPVNPDMYNSGFELDLSYITQTKVTSYISDSKSLQHDFENLDDGICLFKNLYPISGTVIPQYQLTPYQMGEVVFNIQKALYKAFNSRELIFGESIDYYDVYNTIIESDNRIKAVALNNISYTTYMIYKENNTVKRLPINKWIPLNDDYTYFMSENNDVEYVLELYVVDKNVTRHFDNITVTLTGLNDNKYELSQVYSKKEPEVVGSKIKPYTFTTLKPLPDIYKISVSLSNFTNKGADEHDGIDVIIGLKMYDTKDVSKKNVLYNNSFMYLNNSKVYQYYIGANHYFNYLFFRNSTYETRFDSDVINLVIQRLDQSTMPTLKESVHTFDFPHKQYTSITDTPFPYQLQCDIVAKSVLAGKTPYFIRNNKFEFGFNHKNGYINNNLLYIVPQTVIDIQVNSVPGEYIVQDNETIQFYAPNLIDAEDYSTYIRMEHRLNKDISSGEIYRLTAGEQITFFWKDEDDDEKPYTYCKYGPGTIISPNFKMVATRESLICENFPVGRGMLSDDDSRFVYNNYTNGNTIYTIIDENGNSTSTSISQSGATPKNTIHSLSGTKAVGIKKLNIVDLDTSYRLYWVTKNYTEDGDCILFDENVGEYMLESDEYVFYSKDGSSDLAILGSGTKIIRDLSKDSSVWTVKSLEYNSIISDGGDILNDKWYRSNHTIKIQEMQTVMLGSGTEIRLKSNIQDNTPKFTVKFDDNINGPTITTTPETQTKYTLNDFTVEYKSKGGNDWVKLPALDLQEFQWNGRAILNLNMSASTPQILLDNHTLSCLLSDGSITEIKGRTDIKVCVKCESELMVSGGSYVDVRMVDIQTGVKSASSMYIYELDSTVLPDNITVTESSAVINMNSNVWSTPNRRTLNFNLPNDHHYLLTVNVSDSFDTSNITQLELCYLTSTGTQTVLPTYPGKDTVISHSGTYYYLVDTSTISNFNGLVIRCKDNPVPANVNTFSVVFYPIYCIDTINEYVLTPSSIVTDGYEEVIYRITQLDRDSIYMLTFEVDKDIEIVNPLDANSFLNGNHIYNEFTICQIDTVKSVLNVTNITR